MSASRDPYDVLGVSRSASVRQIRAAYVRHARRVHPDLVGHRGLDGMRALNEAWEILKDARRRAAFDAANAVPAATPSPAPVRPDEDSDRPFWTGAAGPPPGRPSGPILDFGIFAGWSLGEVARVDRGYLGWLRDRPEGKPFRAEIARLVDPADDEPATDPRRRGRR